MASSNSIAEIINTLSAEELRKAVLAACNRDGTEAIRNSIWAECLSISSQRSFQSENIDSTQRTTSQPSSDLDGMKMARISQIHRELHGDLASLAYGVCTVYDIPTPSTVLSNADATFRDRFENTRDRARELQLFARETQHLLSRSNEVLSQVQDCREHWTSEEQIPPYSSEENQSSATWRGLNDRRWDKFNKRQLKSHTGAPTSIMP
ncbi:hypothetical protein F4776DRAFT_631787 [Hypoxylon sp. NC0597]|nr:hypothetical protein F4776DRAFT_631787 [Hypoxylon sp. NC0597]